jgi:hypothetical protein
MPSRCRKRCVSVPEPLEAARTHCAITGSGGDRRTDCRNSRKVYCPTDHEVRINQLKLTLAHPLCSGSPSANGQLPEICLIARYSVGGECLARRDLRVAIDVLDPANFELVVARKWSVRRGEIGPPSAVVSAMPMRPRSVLSALKIELWELLDRKQLPPPANLRAGLVA